MPRPDRNAAPLDARGILIVVTAALIAISAGSGIRRLAAHWIDREATITMKQEQLQRLRALLANADAVRDSVSVREARHATMPQLIAARSAAAAGAEVQSFVQDQAQMARVSVQSLDIAGASEVTGAVAVVPVTVTALGDIYGVTAWLEALQRGPRLLDIRELTITPNSALRGEPLQVSVTLRAPFVGAR